MKKSNIILIILAILAAGIFVIFTRPKAENANANNNMNNNKTNAPITNKYSHSILFDIVV